MIPTGFSLVTSKSVCSPVFFVLRFTCLEKNKRKPDAQDAPTDHTWGVMVTTIQLKLSRGRGVGGGYGRRQG